ncbi:RNA polymerase sigma factor SigJ [Streptomyces sp. NBC_01351]|uniref:RNA polymerase sigma factor SigJ n=1 Tax=Streptomyces sp. NBC_01351 TaxID=2903833 RepID=UPI002E2F21B3|nr:RNA polymerase sigma factor SigJ [Streptomyces sp. NBC_01351]
MTETTPAPGDGEPDPGLTLIMSERRQLTNLAYRLLGSLAEAEDAVQETYVRWYAMSREEQEAIESPGAWLTKVAGRICLDLLGSARARRERYVGEWVPEPLPDRTEWMSGRLDHGGGDPADRVTLDESVDMAFLVVLESMTPAERVSFILHDVFRYPFTEVATIVGRTPAACRQLASSARRRIGAARTSMAPARGQAGVVRDFKQAWEAQDIAALVGLLDPDATMIADGGGLVGAALRPVSGSGLIARYLIEIGIRAPGMTLLERSVNGRPGLVAQIRGATVTVAAFALDGDRITRIWAVRNPEKLRPWTPDDDPAAESGRPAAPPAPAPLLSSDSAAPDRGPAV